MSTNIPPLIVVMKNKDKILYRGNAYAVSAFDDKGPFDVLPQHENFIALIKDKVIIHTTPKDKLEMKIDNGIVRISQNKVYIYANFKS
jgi:F0F1-type ATP synthase epsilon subunit